MSLKIIRLDLKSDENYDLEKTSCAMLSHMHLKQPSLVIPTNPNQGFSWILTNPFPQILGEEEKNSYDKFNILDGKL